MAQLIRAYEAGDLSGLQCEEVGELGTGQVGPNHDAVGVNFGDTMFRDIIADLLDRIRLSGTLLFHYELGRPWCLALPRRPDAVFHYLSRGSAIIEFEDGQALPMSAGDFVIVTRGDPHVMWSGRRTKPFSLLDLDRRPAHLGVIRHGGGQQPFSTVICGFFSLSRPLASSVLDLLPSVLSVTPATEDGWLEIILQRLVGESAAQRPRPGGGAFKDDRSIVRRGPPQLGQIARPRRRWIAWCRDGQAHRQSTSADPRTAGTPMDYSRARAPLGAW